MIEFMVSGAPRAKQSFVYTRRGGFTPARVKGWQTEIAIEAERTMRDISRFNNPFTGPLGARIDFGLGNGRRVDLDNLNKAVFDGMNKIVFEDDQQVCGLHLSKRIAAASYAHVVVGTENEINERLFVELIGVLDADFVQRAVNQQFISEE